MKNILAFVFISAAIVACKDENNTAETSAIIESEMSTADKIATANGLGSWNDIKELRFTFNVDRADKHFERSWIWWPKEEIVQMMMGNDTVRYHRKELDETRLSADKEFINDKYWLLAPFHLVWDTGTTISEQKKEKAPISGDSLSMVTLTYGPRGGYTPGDAYDFYFGSDFKVKEWVFREGNSQLPSMTTTWEDYEDFDGLKIAKMHTDSLQSFKIYFTGISVKK